MHFKNFKTLNEFYVFFFNFDTSKYYILQGANWNFSDPLIIIQEQTKANYSQSKSTVPSLRELMQLATAPDQAAQWAYGPKTAKQIIRIWHFFL